MAQNRIYAVVNYEDSYVQPLLIDALKARLPPEILVLVSDISEVPDQHGQVLQWLQYEKIDFDRLMSHPSKMLANSYVIRKALIRKHYLSTTVSHWATKNPESCLQQHVKPSFEFELDFSEFLDEALLEAYELKESWARNESNGLDNQEWWILKPGMSDRGQGIRLFHSEEDLTSIFEEWDPPSDDEDGEIESTGSVANSNNMSKDEDEPQGSGIITSQLRHFIVQPYIDPPLLMPEPHPSAGRKFHIRTYVLSYGALQVYVYRPMLALFGGQSYQSPKATLDSDNSPNKRLPAHLTNTCLQTGEREGSVHAFWSLPQTISTLKPRGSKEQEQGDWRELVFDQICRSTAELFEGAARGMAVHFQPVPNAFELFGVDFMVDVEGNTWLLEVNAFPDFAQTGSDLQNLVKGLFEGCVDVAVKRFFDLGSKDKEEEEGKKGNDDEMVKVLDIDLGRR
ncbi:TTL-domain-containing protein [Polychaeton citri CBS 116435]|uniref:TTL-domain-containing protein n=1 Tax=Polychaeton citri CBS 116435 TaxID=1314669 RepID=A0A9P4QER3_9PEZI|nr:TTL-domain-containing protein [Polychaeton citri CBS 116435]